MATTLKAAVESYLDAKTVARGTRNEYFATVHKWEQSKSWDTRSAALLTDTTLTAPR